MPTVIDELITVLSFRGDATGLQNTRTRLQGMSQDISAAARGLGILGGAIVAVGAGALSQFIPFEDQIAKIRGLVGVSNEELDDMVPRLHEIGQATGVGPAKLADALFRVTSNGLRSAEAMEVLERAATAQAIGLGEASVAANVATSAINAYGSENLSGAQVFDQLTAAIRLGNLETDQMAGSIGRLIPTASNMGIEFHEVAGLMAAMSRTGTDAADAVTQLGQVMFSLLQPSAEAEDTLAEFGYTAKQVREFAGANGLLPTLELLRNSFGDNDEAIGKVFGNIRAFRGVVDLLGPNLAVTTEIMADMADTTGELDGAFDRSETRGRDLRRTMAQLQSGAIALGDALAPIVDMVVGPLTNGIRRLTNLLDSDNEAVRRVAQAVFVFGGLLLGLSATLFVVAGAMRVFAFSLAPITALVNFLRAGTLLLRIQLAALAVQNYATAAAQWVLNIAMYANPIGLIVLAVVALVSAFVGLAYMLREQTNWWQYMRAVVGGVWEVIQAFLLPIWRELVSVWRNDLQPALLELAGMFGLVNEDTEGTSEQMEELVMHFETAARWARYLGESVAESLTKPFRLLADAIRDVNDVLEAFQGMDPRTKQIVTNPLGSLGKALGFAEGGIVPGAIGQPRAAIVHGGEAIFPTEMVRRLSLGPDALAPSFAPPAPAFGGGGRTVTIGDVSITVQVGEGANADEIADTIERRWKDQIEDLVEDFDGPVVR